MKHRKGLFFVLAAVIFLLISGLTFLSFRLDNTCADLPAAVNEYAQAPGITTSTSPEELTIYIVESIQKKQPFSHLEEHLNNSAKNFESTENFKEQLFYCLTDSLFAIVDKRPSFDTLVQYALWSRNLKQIHIASDTDAIDYQQVLYNSWLRYLVTKMDTVNFAKLSVCNQENFVFLEKSLKWEGFTLKNKQSSLEKVIFNIRKKNWGHLLTSVYYQTSFVEKVGITIGFVLTLLLYIVFIVQIFIRSSKWIFKRKNKHNSES